MELDAKTVMTTDTHLPHSVNINLKCVHMNKGDRFNNLFILINRRGNATDSPKITFPAVQGMSFVTAGYQNASPLIQTGKSGFKYLSSPVLIGRSTKYHVKDADGRDWLVYVNPAMGISYDATNFRRLNPNSFMLPPNFKGTIQVARNPSGVEAEGLYDKTYGTFVVEAMLSATVSESKGTYSFNYTKVGSGPLLMFILPHHLQSIDPELKNHVTNLRLQSTTKGTATAIWADTLTFIEPSLPTSMGFAPWTPSMTPTRTRYPNDFLALLAPVAEHDLRRALAAPFTQESYYYAGKALSRLATLTWVLRDILNDADATATALGKLKREMARYVDNVPRYPVYYDDTWKGLVSRAGLDGSAHADFGNSFYNDHHFHFGYFIYAAAVIGYVDPTWLVEGGARNRRFVNLMVKDVAEGEYEGRDFPFQRCFDWWAGHSWYVFDRLPALPPPRARCVRWC